MFRKIVVVVVVSTIQRLFKLIQSISLEDCNWVVQTINRPVVLERSTSRRIPTTCYFHVIFINVIYNNTTWFPKVFIKVARTRGSHLQQQILKWRKSEINPVNIRV